MFATIYLPNFYLQAALRHERISSATPVGLIDERDNKAVIIQLNEAAEHAGVRIGMAPSQGLARCLSLVIKARSRIKEESLTNILIQNAFILSPYVEATAPGLCTVQFTDNRELSGKVSRVVQNLAGCEIQAHAGIAPTPDISFLAAHLAKPVLEIDDPQKFLGPLSIDVLAIPFQS